MATFHCPSCGGMIIFDTATQKFRCASCGNEQHIEPPKNSVEEYDFSEYREREGKPMLADGEVTFTCASCGAQIFMLAQETAAVCPMCGAPQLRVEEQNSGIPVEGVVPFKIDRYEAQKLFGSWIRKRWFAPNSLRKLYAEGDLHGLYVPFWTYDAQAEADYFGRGGRTQTRTSTVDGKTVTETYTVWFPVSGHVRASFNDVQVCASRNASGNLIQKVLPYNTIGNTHPYQPQYLSGYEAEHYTVDGIAGFEIARTLMEKTLRGNAESDIMSHGYSMAEVTSLQARYNQVRYKHVLVPLWKAKYGYAGKDYHYMINGETGKVSAQYPISPWKVALAVLAALAIIVGIVFLSGGFDSSSSGDSGYSTAYSSGYSYYSSDGGNTASYDSGDIDYGGYDYGYDYGGILVWNVLHFPTGCLPLAA